MDKDVLTYNLSEPLNGAMTARIDIHAGDGNLKINRLTSGELELANGILQYFPKQGQPTKAVTANNGQVSLTLRGGRAGQPWFRLPWAACNGATEWQVHINPAVSSAITAHSDGGNVTLDLAGTILTSLSADTGGGNVDVILPDIRTDLSVDTKTGAGNVTIQLPDGIEARIHASSGLGKVIVDPRFKKIAEKTYQSDGYDNAARKGAIEATSGAGNVTISIR